MDDTIHTNGHPYYDVDPLEATAALILFVKFQDDTTNPTSCHQTHWPASLGTALPTWADDLLSPSSTRVADYREPSISDYFDEMSLQNHWVYGEVINDMEASGLDGNCYIAPYDMDEWGSGEARFDSLNWEIMVDLVAEMDATVDFADYDINPRDGHVDQIWMFYRDFPTTFINDAGAGGIGELVRDPIETNDTVVVDGDTLVVDIWRQSGTTQAPNSREAAIYITAHEHGHYMYSHIDGRSWHLLNTGRFSLMGQFSGLASTPNIFEREYLGWLTPTELTSDSLGISLPNAIASGKGIKVPINGSETEYFLAENRVKWGANASYYENPDECAKEQGFKDLPGAGVLIFHHDDSGGFGSLTHNYLDVEWAAGMFDTLGNGDVDETKPNPIAGRDALNTGESEGDPETFFAENQTMSIFTPYTDPSTHGYKHVGGTVWEQKVPSGINFLRISSKMDVASLDVVFSDTSKAYHVRADVDTTIWRGTIYLTTDVTVDSLACLRIADADGNLTTDVMFRKDYDSQSSGVAASQGELIVAGGGRLLVQGTNGYPVEIKSTANPLDEGDWYGVRVKANGSLDLSYADVAWGEIGVEAVGPKRLYIDDSAIHHHTLIGVYEEAYTDTVEIHDSQVYANGYAGVSITQPKWLSATVYKMAKLTGSQIHSNGGVDVELMNLGGNGVHVDSVRSCAIGSSGSSGEYGVYSDRSSSGSGHHKTILHSDTLTAYTQDAIVFAGVQASRVRRSRFNGSIGRALAVGYGAQVFVDSTRFGTGDDTHVWSDDGATTILGDTTAASSSKGYNAFYLPGDTVMVTNDDADTLKAENNWWNHGALCNQPPSANYFVGPVDRAPWLCSPPSLMRPSWDIDGEGAEEALLSEGGIGLTAAPNPFQPFTTIRYRVPSTGTEKRDVEISIADVGGRMVRHSLYAGQDPGTYEFHWHGEDIDGRRVPAGVYFVRIRVGAESTTAKLVLAR